ncbi:MAG: cytochrome bc complex cytochrome b subunit [Chloroflexi bacterium]|nr:cytochrome bc complex cytochrome b subunit [Chloroflexota bacterium]
MRHEIAARTGVERLPARQGSPAKEFWDWLDERLGLQALAYPVPAHANSILYTLGGITLAGFAVLVATGVYMAQFYHPHPADARESIAYFTTQAQFGSFVRSVHFWTANLVVITASLHMLRVFFTASYKRPREVNWLIGVGLVTMAMALFFTGTVLKWDQEAYEALAHNEAVAKTLGSLGSFATGEFARSVPLLTRLYVVHVSILPALLGLLLLLHLFLVKHHGISPLPGQREMKAQVVGRGGGSTGAAPVPTSTFNLHLRKMLGYGLLLTAMAAILALALPAALGPTATPGMEVTKPPWLFWWLYAFENWFGIKALFWGAVAVPLLLALVPFFDRSPSRKPTERRWFIGAAAVAIAALVSLTIYVALSPVAQHIGGE